MVAIASDMSEGQTSWTLKQQVMAWVVTLTGAMFFFYEFIQMNMFNSLSQSFEHTFHLSSFQIGIVASFYFLSDTVLLLPAGMLLDVFSSKKLLVMGMVMCILGTFLITMADNSWFLVVARFLAGTASAFCLLSVLRLAAQWFPHGRMAQVTGVVVTLGMLGGAVSQTPLTWMIQEFGWRGALRDVAIFGVVILVAILIVVRDAPESQRFTALQSDEGQEYLGFWKSVYRVCMNRENWLAGLYISTMNLPIMLLAGLFGTQTMMQTEGFTAMQAATISMMIFLGTIVGSSFFGFLSDWMKNRRVPMILAAVISLGIFLVFMLTRHLGYEAYIALFFLLGFFTGAQIIGYPVTRESNSEVLLGTALGFISVLIMSIPAVLQPVMGWILNSGWHGAMMDGVRFYAMAAYEHAMIILVVGFVVSIISVLLLPETYGRYVEENNE